MKVLVVGANGQIGQHIVKQLKNSDEHTVRAMVRKEEQAEELKKKGIDAVIANLEGSKKSLVKAAKGCDAVIFTAGSGRSEEHTSELQSRFDLVCRLLLEKKN